MSLLREKTPLRCRAIARSETEDFRKWPPARVFLAPGPEDSPFDDYYTNCFTWYPGDPSVRFLFPAIYHHDTDQLDIRLAVSRDNYAWNWVSHEPIIDIGKPGEWDCGSVYAGPNLVRLPDGRLALPLSGAPQTHNESYDVYEDPVDYEFQTAWAIWDDGRLAGIEAAERGEFWTPIDDPFEGERITINARTSRAGRIEVGSIAGFEHLGLGWLWRDGRRPAVDRWWAQLQETDAFRRGVAQWLPDVAVDGMRAAGAASESAVRAALEG